MMSKQQKIHLFNCDHTYKLDTVKIWMNTAKSKRELELPPKQHYFSLSQMTELSSKTIPELDMDVAVFVVHAHESRLSINEENAGIGYAMIYRALLQKTGGKVIIVIGGDDSYKDEDEEDKEFISRWARRKISSQFSEEFMDGRKSFIFSWDKKHREIHEKALLHFLDPSKKGQKFEHQPPTKPPLPQRPTTPPPVRPSEPEAVSRPYSSLPAEGHYTGGRVHSTKPVVPVESRAHRISDQGARPMGNRSSSTETKAERPYTGERVHSTKPDVPVESRAHRISDQGAQPKEKRSSSTETKDLVILGCSISERSMQAVMQEIENIGPHLNLRKEPPVENLSPAEIKQYLERNWLKFCVLVVDAESVQDAYENLPKRRDEYEDLLKTAVNKVAEKVIILVCDDLPLKPQDEAIVHETIECIVKKKDKGFIAWLKKGRLTVDSDVLAQILKSNTAQNMPQSGSEGFRGQTNVHFDATTESRQAAYEEQTRGYQQTQGSRTIQQPYVSTKHTGPSSGEQVKLKSKLYYGNISYQPRDREIHPGFVVPSYVRDALLQQYGDVSDAEVKIVADPQNGALRWIVNSKTTIAKGAAANEMLKLKTRVRKGLVSLKESDVVYRCPNWNVPVYVTESLIREFWATPEGELCVFSDEKGNVSYKVDVGAKNRFVGFAKKTWKKI